MSKQDWIADETDEEALASALAEAERQGLNLDDYLIGLLLNGEAVAPPEGAGPPALRAAPVEEISPFRHKLQALERRFSGAVNGLDGAVHALDASLHGIAARVDQTETLAADTADVLDQALQDMGALRSRADAAERQQHAAHKANEHAHDDIRDKCALLASELAETGRIARRAEETGESVALAQDALQQAVAQDFNRFSEQTLAQIGTSLGELREAADAAARHADKAAEHLIGELRALRKRVDQQLTDSAAETRARMHAAFADAAERHAALAERVDANESALAKVSEQLRAQINNVEDAAQTALEETADGLRQAHSALAVDLARSTTDHAAALEAARAEVADEIAALHEDANQQIRALAGRVADGEAAVTHARQALGADIERVEACTLAALEKLSGDSAAGDAALREEVQSVLAHSAEHTETALALAETRIKELREQHGDLRAQLDRIAAALGPYDQSAAPFSERLSAAERNAAQYADQAVAALNRKLAQVEAIAGDHSEIEQALAALSSRVEALTGELSVSIGARVSSQVEDLNGRIAGQIESVNARVVEQAERLSAHVAENEANNTEITSRLATLGDRLAQAGAESAQAAERTEEKLRNFELALADLRLETLSPPAQSDSSADGEALAAIAARLDDLEQRQASAFDTLRADIALFIGENDKRLELLEQAEPAGANAAAELAAEIEARLAQLEHRDLGLEFETLRLQIEERILNVENRSVKVLAQIGDTVALLERRFLNDDSPEAQSA